MKRKYSYNHKAGRAATEILPPDGYDHTGEAHLIVTALEQISAGTQASADFFNDGLPDSHPARVSRQTVWTWGKGRGRVSDARLRLWKRCFDNDDVRHHLAIAIQLHRETNLDGGTQ